MRNYDIFFTNHHPVWAERFLLWCNRALLSFLRTRVRANTPTLRILEIGPGKGYFYRACQASQHVSYVACDRNDSFRTVFPEAEFHEGVVPPLPVNIGKFDVIYAAYVIEHLADGLAVAEFVRSCRERLNQGGVLVVSFPDVLRQQFEFFNMDYTHRYPTTGRNVTMALLDTGFTDIESYSVNGLLTVPGFYLKPMFLLLRVSLFWYSYRLMQCIFGWVIRVPLSSLENPFYRFYCLAKQENLLYIARK